MAVQNETVSSVADLITKLDTYMATRGWTAEHLDITSTAGTGGEWAMRKDNVRFAASWDAANSGTKLALYQYSDQNYVIGDRPWGQDHDSGNGAASTLEADIEDERHVVLAAAPIQYWAFDPENLGSYMAIVVETSTGVFCHFGFAELDKRGDWDGGECVWGQKNNTGNFTSGLITLDSVSFLLDGFLNDTTQAGGSTNDTELFAATIRCVDLPNQPTDGMYAVSMGGNAASPQTDFGTDHQSNDGASSDIDRVMFIDGIRAGPWANGFSRTDGTDIGGETRMWPIAPRYYDSSTGDTYGPMGFLRDIFGCSVAIGLEGGTIITDENDDQYYIFPAEQRWETGTGKSGYLGVAYKIASYIDPGLPVSVASNVTGWFSSRSSDDYTIDGGGELTQLDDKTGNGADCTQANSNGPTLTNIDGRNWMTFGSVADPNGDRLSCSFSASAAMDPGSGDFSCVLVYRNSVSSVHVGPFVKSQGTGGGADPDAHYGMRFNRTANDQIEAFARDITFSNPLNLFDVLSTYSDGSSQIVGWTYDTSIADALMFGDNNDPTTAVASNLVWATASIIPGGSFNIGARDTVNPFDGEIAELIFFDTPLTIGQRGDVWDYLKDKWGIS